MAKKKDEPIITQTELLALAGKVIQAEILRLREEAVRLSVVTDTPERIELAQSVLDMNATQQRYHMDRLEAVETMYRIQTGVELGLLMEVQGEE